MKAASPAGASNEGIVAEAAPDRHDTREPRVTIVHDYLTQKGGAERVVLAMLKAFPKAQLTTLFYDREKTFPDFEDYDIGVSRLNRCRAFRKDPRLAFPLLSDAVRQLSIGEPDIVLCSTSGWAHGVRTQAPKVVYCYNPARWLYQTREYLGDRSIVARLALAAQKRRLVKWDAERAAEATAYLTSSSVVASRIRQTYRIEAQIIPPPVTLADIQHAEAVGNLEPGFFLVVGRKRSYKNLDLACGAFRSLPARRLVVVGELPPCDQGASWPNNIFSIQKCSDSELRWLYANCRAVLGLAHEDFGLTPLEGNSFGRPALVLRTGGYLDTVKEGVTGLFIDSLDVGSVMDGVNRIANMPFDQEVIRDHASRYSAAGFHTQLRSAVMAVYQEDPCLKVPNVGNIAMSRSVNAGDRCPAGRTTVRGNSR